MGKVKKSMAILQQGIGKDKNSLTWMLNLAMIRTDKWVQG